MHKTGTCNRIVDHQGGWCFCASCCMHTTCSNLQVLEALLARQDLDEEQAQHALEVCVHAHCLAPPVHNSSQTLLDSGCAASMASFLVLLRAKGETAAEVAGLAKAMHSKALRVSTPHDGVCCCCVHKSSLIALSRSVGHCGHGR